MITVSIAAWIPIAIILWITIGLIFSYFMAISPQAVVVLIFLWPIFAVLLLCAPLINYFANRNLNKEK